MMTVGRGHGKVVLAGLESQRDGAGWHERGNAWEVHAARGVGRVHA
jgi:hypothetical protein